MPADEPPKPFTLLQKVLLIALVFGTPIGIWYWNHDKQSSASTSFPSVTLGVLTAATSTAFTCGVSTVKDADNNVYNTVLIGSQCWMKQNMRVGTRINIASNQTSTTTIQKWCYDDTLANCMTNNNPNQPDGGLYQWNMAMQFSTTPGARGICPQGFHIPTHDEFTTLERAVCTSASCATDFPYDTSTTGLRGTNEDIRLKPNGTSGFEANLNGFGYAASYNSRGSGANVWSSSQISSNAWYRGLSPFPGVSRNKLEKAYGFSVRCLRDSPATTINQTLPNPTLDTGLVGHWTFDGPNVDWSSTTAEIRDTSGYGNTGNAQNMTTQSVAQGRLGQGLQFITPGNQSVTVAASASLDNIAAKTLTAWVRIRNTTPNKFIGKGSGTYGHWTLMSSTNGTVRFFEDFSIASGQWQTSSSVLQPNEWFFLTLTYDRTSVTNDPIIYVNGSVAPITETLTPSGTATLDTSANVLLGNDTSDINPLNGTIDDVRIYNRALTAAEVKRLYQLGQGVTVDGFVCGQSRVQDRDLNWYDTVLVGTQCWMKQNMRVGTMVTVATTQTNNGTIEKWCYSNTLANCMTNNNPNQPDGGLYQWNEAMQYSTTPGARGICPQGFHIPTDAEQYTLENYLKDNGQTCNASRVFAYDCSTAGTKLKPNGTSGFEGNLAGYGWSGFFYDRGANGDFWSSSESGGNAWYRFLGSAEARVYRDSNGKSYGFSVRCLRD